MTIRLSLNYLPTFFHEPDQVNYENDKQRENAYNYILLLIEQNFSLHYSESCP